MKNKKKRRILWITILLMFVCAMTLSACSNSGYSIGFLWKIKIEGEYKTEYLYGEEFVQPDFYVKDTLPFTKWKQAEASKLKIYGFDSAELGERTITVWYYYTKWSYKEFTYQIKINPLQLLKPVPVVDENGKLILTPAEGEYKYLLGYDISLQGISVDSEDIEFNGQQNDTFAEVNIKEIMERNAYSVQEGYILEVTAISSQDYVLDSPTASLTFGYSTVSGGGLEGLRTDWQNSMEGYHQFSLFWTDGRLEGGEYLITLQFSNGNTETLQQRTSETLTQNGVTYYSSGTIDWRRWLENQTEPVRMDKLIVTFRAKDTSDRIYRYQNGTDVGIIAKYEITVKNTANQKPELVMRILEETDG